MQAERLRERVAAVGQAPEQREAERQQGDPYQLEDQPPAERFAHRLPFRRAGSGALLDAGISAGVRTLGNR